MKQSQLFTKTKKESPTDEVSKNAELLIRGGFIHKEMAGVYSSLPLGLRVLKKIENIIREEINAIGGQEISMTALQEKSIWEKTNRWDDQVVDNWFKTKLKNDSELGLAFSHEEPLTRIMADYISSYRDLPKAVYQFQVKFRNEARAKSGIMRCREFLMKDLYSFCKSQEEQDEFYEKVKEAYIKIFQRIGIGHLTYLTFASGGSFSKYSHEFQTITAAGEDTIYVDKDKGIAINREVYNDEVLKNLGLSKDSLVENRAVEVGNIFPLGLKYSEPLGLVYQTEKGDKQPVFMGSYGIGLGRLMGTTAEVLSDDRGIIWPESIAPFRVHLLSLGESEAVTTQANEVYENLQNSGIEILFDDRVDVSAGEKFADADLIGCPYRLVISPKTLESQSGELKKRSEEKTELIKISDLSAKLK